MRLSGIVAVGVAFVLASQGSAGADPAGAQKEFMRVFGLAQPPYGFVNFCERMPRECAPGRPEEQRFDATPERFVQLDAINRAVNHEIEPVTDLELYGEADHWTIPTTRGDCEDYVLLKRKRLIALGWPPSALLITVVRDERGDGHAVLTARTQQGDFILDNKTDEIRIWYRVRYQFVMRQSYLNPRVWMSLDPKERTPTMSLAGVRNGR
jgi:predicted transglutaminase-like cysteine proteinase